MFLDVRIFQLHCCLYRVRKLSNFIKNILICVSKMNEVTGLKRLQGDSLITVFTFLGELCL